ncbi:tripartite tricarboxylate transporter substrate binding protein [Lihuaxuella thermophila]
MLVTGCSPLPSASDPAGQTAESGSGYPAKQIEYVVPFAPGGGTDLVARAVAEYLSEEWGQPVVVVNKPGGGGAVAAQYVLKQSARDGYTVMANNVSSTTMMAAGMADPPVKLSDHLFVSRIVEDPIAFTVKADAPWKDFKEFSDWVKKHPEQLTWTSVGPAGTSAFGVAEWLKAIGVDFSKTRMITTKGASDSMPKVAGGHAVLAVHSVAEVYSMAKAGKVKILAVQAEKRSPYFPDVPTAEEQGIKGMSVKWWTGVSMPAGTPAHVVKKWDETIAKMVKDPAFLKKLNNIHVQSSYLNSADFTRFVKEETRSYTRLATETGIRK